MIQTTNGHSSIKLAPLAPLLDDARRFLVEHLPWSPLDFVPGISRRGDRAIHAEELTRPLDEAHDFRFRATLADGAMIGLFAQLLPWDTEFFGYGVAKLDGVFPLEAPTFRPRLQYAAAIERLLHKLSHAGARYVWSAVDPRDLALLRALGEVGFSLIETRYFQHGPVRVPEAYERQAIRQATPADVPSLAQAARQTVNPYDRFHADPFLDEHAVGALMEKWVEQSVAGRMADLVLVPDVAAPGAFVTYRYHRDRWSRWGLNLVQGLLSAVSPEFMGWMGKLGPEVNARLRSVGAEYSYGSTQVTNRSIIWFAQEAGANYGKCEHIFRIIL